MEVLPCSSVKYTGESDCAQQNAVTGFLYKGESNGIEHVEYVHKDNGRVDDIVLNAERLQIERRNEGQGIVDELPLSKGHHSGATFSDCQVENQSLPRDCHEDGVMNVEAYSTGPCIASEKSHLILGSTERESNNYSFGEQTLSDSKWLELDESAALWVKWRGMWQAGIRCARADWPLSTLKAKPTHDRKKYFVIFFPHTRNYSWADTLLVRPINEFPQPNAYETHNSGLKMVKDLSVARRFIMQKLAVGMLNIVDQFHTEALLETARDVLTWKEFALEASHCCGYSDLGRMLLKLHSMILPCHINSDWLENSFQLWVRRCQVAQSAESIELLKEELSDSILWDEVNSLWDAPVQPTLGSEWKTWKHEVMKWFSTSHPILNDGDMEQQGCDSRSSMSLQVSRKRPKLEIRRAEVHPSQAETSSPLQTMTIDIDSEFFDNRDNLNIDTLGSELSKGQDFREGAAPVDSPCSVADRWDEIVVEAGNSGLVQAKDVEMTPANHIVAQNIIDPGNKSQQCVAFIESKGRQCVRWANDGDVYCCVHLASRFAGCSTKSEATPPVHSPLCDGTTVLGNRCKHRSLPGSSFCKKHRPRADSLVMSNIPENTRKREHEEIIPSSETTYCKDVVLLDEVGSPPLQVEPVSMMDDDAYHGRNILNERIGQSSQDYKETEIMHCIGSCPYGSSDPCHESPKRYSLYCDKHIPSWLKRARNGKSRIISKDVFTDLLNGCCSSVEKLQLHQACELFYKLFKSILSHRNPVPVEIQLQWALSEASKDFRVGELLLKLASSEKERLKALWGFDADEVVQVSPSVVDETTVLPLANDDSPDDERAIRCKICSEEFLDDQELGSHWMDNHKKEAQWHFRGHACAICLDSFTNKKVLETHVQERHHVQFVEQCMLLQCIPCGSHFGNIEELWLHVLSVHPAEFRLSKAAQQFSLPTSEERDASVRKVELGKTALLENSAGNSGGVRRYVCRFCGLKFDLLPDLGRHHQAAHMDPNMSSSRPQKRGIRYYAYRLKSGRLSRPQLKKGLGAAAFRNRSSANMKKHIQPSKPPTTLGLNIKPEVTEVGSFGKLAGSQCSAVANILFSEIQKTKPRPNNHDILAIARSACCKVSLKESLEGIYGVLPECFYLKAAKLCSEHNIQVEWHQEGFICSRGCKSFKDPAPLPPLIPFPNDFAVKQQVHPSDRINSEWEIDECHYVINLHDFREGPMQNATVLCTDISFGKETVPVSCVVDEEFLDSLNISTIGSDGKSAKSPMPWESFTYVTKPLYDQAQNQDIKCLQLGCACPHSVCCPETCDHVYLFDNDYEDAKDIHGKSMFGRFPYDDKGRVVLEEGYLVYECNNMCHCNRSCTNRVLQNGIRVKLEVFRTENKGWAVRAGEPILRGTFVCEYIGEVLSEAEASKRRDRFDKDACNYMYNIDAHTNDMGRLIEGQLQYVIDSTKYGNVSRFINHSCLPNLVNHQVLVDSMDSQRAHIGLYASRDIASGEELTYNYRYEMLPGEGYPCNCGASKCRGRLY